MCSHRPEGTVPSPQTSTSPCRLRVCPRAACGAQAFAPAGLPVCLVAKILFIPRSPGRNALLSSPMVPSRERPSCLPNPGGSTLSGNPLGSLPSAGLCRGQVLPRPVPGARHTAALVEHEHCGRRPRAHLSQGPGVAGVGAGGGQGESPCQLPRQPLLLNLCSSSNCLCHFTSLGLSFPMCGVAGVSP